MLAHAHVALAQCTGGDGLLLGRKQVGGRQVGKQGVVNVFQCLWRIQVGRALGPGVALFQRLLGFDVGDGQALLSGQSSILGEVLPQGLVDFVRAGVLPLDAVGVVGVHAAQQAAQLWRHAGARQGGGQPGQVMRLGQQGFHASVGWQQGLELVDFCVHQTILPKLDSL